MMRNFIFLLFGMTFIILGPVQSQVICRSGEKACGFQCYDKYSSKKCHPGGILCDHLEDVCGYQCYMKSLANKCYPGGVLCNFDEKPCGWRCYKPSMGETCNEPTGLGPGVGPYGPRPGHYPYPGVPAYGPGMPGPPPYFGPATSMPYPPANSNYGPRTFQRMGK